MRLYVECRHCGFLTYLNIVVEDRHQLVDQLDSYYFDMECFHCGISDSYNVNDVYAEEGPSAVPVGAILGGVLGALIGGPIGLLLGGGIGAAAGGGGDAQERDRVNNFNREVV